MKCERCEREATVHELRVVSGSKIEKHLCESCAREEGIQVQGPGSVGELVGQLMMAASGPSIGAKATRGAACPACLTSFAEFRQSGLLGCPRCYSTFESQLIPLLERAHEGGVRHVGKTPRRMLRGRPDAPAAVQGTAARDKAERIATLRKHLEDAIRAEQYERAAALRDEIRKLDEAPASGTPSDPS